MGYWITAKVENTLGELINFSMSVNDKALNVGSKWQALDSDEFAPFMTMQDKSGESPVNMEIETRDSTEKNAGSNEESENEQPLMRNMNSMNSDPENQGDILNTTQ